MVFPDRKKALLFFSPYRLDFSHPEEVPSIVFSGADRLRNDPAFTFSVCWKGGGIWKLLWLPCEKYLVSRMGVGFRLGQALRHVFLLRRQDIILAKTDSLGLPLLLLKRLRIIRARVGFFSAGLVNQLEGQQQTRLFRWYRWLLQSADFIICWSPLEEKMYRDLMQAHAHFVLLEPDTRFYQPGPLGAGGNGILCVGNDPGRDFYTLFSALANLGFSAKVLTKKSRIQRLSVPDNVELQLEYVDYPTLLDWYREARLVIVNVREIHRFTGQRALLEALSMGKATIVARTQAIESTYKLQDGRNVVFYKPGDVQDLMEKIRLLYHNDSMVTSLSVEARQFAQSIPSDSFYQHVRSLCLGDE